MKANSYHYYYYYLFLFFSALLIFLVYYGSFPFTFGKSSDAHKIINQHLGREGLIIINVLIFAVFLVFLNVKKNISWKGTGLYIGFFISLFTEMFGLFLVFYFLFPSINYPVLKKIYPFSVINMKNIYLLNPVNLIFCSLAITLILIGMALVFIGWKQVYFSKEFTAKGLYKHVRHPQYLGISLMTFGWVIGWPTLITWLIWPLLIFAYYRQAKKEEKGMIKKYGQRYIKYMKKTKMLIPF